MANVEIDDPAEEALLGASFDQRAQLQGITRFSAADWMLILLLGSLSALGPLAIDLYLPSFPTIAAEFHTTVHSVERTLAAYFIGLSLGQLVYGPLADRWGRKPPLYFGLVMFTLASVGCALTNSLQALTALRLLQALGGCAQMVISRAVVRDRFGPQDAARVFAALMLVMGLAPILAPTFGGWAVVHLGWRPIFWFLALFGVLCTIAVAVRLPETLAPKDRDRHGLGIVLRNYVRLLQSREFMGYTLAASLASAGLFAYVGGSPFVFIELFHVKTQWFGLLFGANAFALIAGTQIGGVLVRQRDPRVVMRWGLCTALAASGVLLTMSLTNTGGLAGIFAPLFVFMGSLGIILPTTTALAMSSQARSAGSASAVLGCLQFMVSGTGGMLISNFQNGTSVPMAGMIAGCTGAALLAGWLAGPSR